VSYVKWFTPYKRILYIYIYDTCMHTHVSSCITTRVSVLSVPRSCPLAHVVRFYLSRVSADCQTLRGWVLRSGIIFNCFLSSIFVRRLLCSRLHDFAHLWRVTYYYYYYHYIYDIGRLWIYMREWPRASFNKAFDSYNGAAQCRYPWVAFTENTTQDQSYILVNRAADAILHHPRVSSI